ncbi:MAG TPA: DUF1559 domain-containing protein [Pirellulales bacterium]|jgi:prepilin-type N-terminal cleavage/methylation domain-containing protein/prepilin-type processing-associated H-X9-DG protein
MIRRRKRGFTLVELLVVISIIGTLVAMLLPAVQAAREAARRNTCSNNQHQLSIAVASYVTSKQFYPGYRETVITNGGAFPVSWAVALLPFMDNRPAFDLWKQTTQTTMQPPSNVFSLPFFFSTTPVTLEFMACPSDIVTDTSTTPAPNSYVVNTGQMDVNLTYGAMMAPNNFSPDSPANGVFLSRWEYPLSPQNFGSTGGQSQENKLQKTVDGNFFDGKTNTFLLSENVMAKNWYDTEISVTASSGNYSVATTNGYNTAPYNPQSATGNHLTVNAPATTSPELYSGFVWWPQLAATNSLQNINGLFNASVEMVADPLLDFATDMNYCRPSSNHPGGVNMTFADGRTQYVNENIDYTVYASLMTPEGRKCNPPGFPFAPTTALITNASTYGLSSAQASAYQTYRNTQNVTTAAGL